MSYAWTIQARHASDSGTVNTADILTWSQKHNASRGDARRGELEIVHLDPKIDRCTFRHTSMSRRRDKDSRRPSGVSRENRGGNHDNCKRNNSNKNKGEKRAMLCEISDSGMSHRSRFWPGETHVRRTSQESISCFCGPLSVLENLKILHDSSTVTGPKSARLITT